MLWQKFRGQFVYLFISLVCIVLTLSLYDDVYDILKISNQDSLWVLMLVKYSILIIIISVNVQHFKSIKVVIPTKKTIPQIKLDPAEEKILQKDVLKSKTDFILEKYKSKKDV